MRKQASYLLKCITVVSALGGVASSLIAAKSHGYSHWSKRLLYFTAQSNLWIGLTMLALVVFSLRGKKPPAWLYVLKYVFTVSITLTGLVFCFLLGPFADESYHPWAFSSWLTHAITPALAVAEFFTDEERIPLRGKQVLLSVVPPLLYFIPATLLCVFNTDFGRGEPYPYFFMNYRSPAGIFGFSDEPPFVVGSFYWYLLFSLIVLGIGFLYIRLHNKKDSSR